MKRILQAFFQWILVGLAVFAGNWLGGELRFMLTGERPQTWQFRTTTAKGRQLANSPVASKFYPGLLAALVGKPRVLFAFLGGILAGALVPDAWEQAWIETIIEPLFIDRVAPIRPPHNPES